MPHVEPYTQLTRYSPEVSHELSRIEAALARIKAADILPASAEALRFAAEVGTIHYSTLIEGNRLGLLEAQRAARGVLDRTTKAEIELVNYVDALAELDRRLEADGLVFDEALFKDVHKQATKGLGTPEGPFMPHHEGEWRDGEADVFDHFSGMLVHTGAPRLEVRPRMLALIDWVNRKLKNRIGWPAPVIAGMLHFNVAEVHPFADGNGRTARLLTAALLMREGYAPCRLFNFDAHYGVNKDAYLEALRSVRTQTWNQETWMRYFLGGLAAEYERVLGEIDRLSVIGHTANGQKVQLTDQQQQALVALRMRNVSEFNRRDYEDVSSAARTAAAADLKMLTDSGLLVPVGNGPSRRYRFPNAPTINSRTQRGAGRPTEWTNERIERELRILVGDSDTYPTVNDFKASGHTNLMNAINRNGGRKAWAERVGIALPVRPKPPPARSYTETAATFATIYERTPRPLGNGQN